MLSKFYWLLIAAKHSNTGTYIAFETPLLVVFACSVGGWAMSRQRLVKDAFFVSFLLYKCHYSMYSFFFPLLLFIVSDVCSGVGSSFFCR